MEEKRHRIGAKIILGITALFFYLPILYIIVFSFNDSRSLTKFSGFSLRWYEKMFSDSAMMQSVVYTIVIAILATIISTVAGTLAAIGLSRSRKALRNVVEQVNNLPIMNPEIVTAIGLLMFFSALGINKGFTTLLLAHIMFCTPYVILSVSPKLRSLDPNLADAALDLGATPMQALTKVIVPQIMPGIVSGALIAFTMSFDDFIISYFVTGNGVNNISILVYIHEQTCQPFHQRIVHLGHCHHHGCVDRCQRSTHHQREKEKKGMKKLIAMALASVMLLAGCGGSSEGASSADAVEKYGSDTLKLYNWGEYMGEDLISNFEKEFGVKVIVEYFDSNETMYTKLQAGDSYDVLVPSDYMIERLIKEGMLQELDLSLIPNISNLAEGVKGLPYDPENTYSVPYFWGSVGIVYNHNNVDPAVVEEQGYNILHNTDYKGKIYVYDSERDSFMMAFKALGYSMNTDNQDEIQEAYQWLLDMNNTMEPVYVTDEVIDGMINGTKDIAVVYSGDATTILSENPDMSFWMPNEGTNLWSDAMVIPANAANPKLAHEFINYVLTYEASLGNSEYVGYASSNQEVLDELSGEGGLFAENEAYLPRSGYEKDEVFVDNQVLKKELAELWIKVKATK